MSSPPSTEAGVLRPWHVFLVFSLIGASVAVLRAQNNSLSNLLLVSLAVVSAGFVGLMTLRTLWPLAATEGDQEATVPRGRARVRPARWAGAMEIMPPSCGTCLPARTHNMNDSLVWFARMVH